MNKTYELWKQAGEPKPFGMPYLNGYSGGIKLYDNEHWPPTAMPLLEEPGVSMLMMLEAEKLAGEPLCFYMGQAESEDVFYVTLGRNGDLISDGYPTRIEAALNALIELQSVATNRSA